MKHTPNRSHRMGERNASRYGPTPVQALLEALESLRMLGRRSVLALIGIAVGCAAVVALLNIGNSAGSEATSIFKDLGTNKLVVSFLAKPGSTSLAPALIDVKSLLIAVPEIEQVAPLNIHSALIRHHGETSDATIIGTTSGLASILGLRLRQGRFLSDFDRQATYAIAGADITRKLGLRPGSRLQAEGYLFEIIGIIDEIAANPLTPINVNDSVFVPIEGMRRLQSSPEISMILAETRGVLHLDSYAQSLKTYLGTVSNGRDVHVQIPRHLIDSLERQSDTFTYLLGGLGGISLLVGGVGVMNVMLMNVTERRREIGVRIALGARPCDIRNLFLLEASALSTIGALLGATVGLAFAYAFAELYSWPFSLSSLSLPLGIISSSAIGLFFGLYPAMTAARMQPIQALRDD